MVLSNRTGTTLTSRFALDGTAIVHIDYTSAGSTALKGISSTPTPIVRTNGSIVSKTIVSNEGPANIYFDTNTGQYGNDVQSLVKPSAVIEVEGSIENITLRSEGLATVQIIAII